MIMVMEIAKLRLLVAQNLLTQLHETSIYIKLPRLSVFLSISLCVCLSSGFLKNVRTDFRETFHGSYRS